MKKYAFLGYLLLCLMACQQDTPSNSNNTTTNCSEPSATLKFKFNGTLIEINGSLSQNAREGSVLRKEQVTGTGNSNPLDNQTGDVINNTNYCFSLLATKNFFYSDDGEPLLEIEFRASSITAPSTFTRTDVASNIREVNTYYPLQTVTCGTKCSAGTYPGTSFTLTFTKVVNGYADGTFSGILSDDRAPATNYPITEGEFHNVKIIQ